MISKVRNHDLDLLEFLESKHMYPINDVALSFAGMLIGKEVVDYSRIPDSTLRMSTAVDMESFSLKVS